MTGIVLWLLSYYYTLWKCPLPSFFFTAFKALNTSRTLREGTPIFGHGREVPQ